MRDLIPKIVLQEIEGAGVQWEVVHGGRHYKLFIHDRLAGILPYGKAAKQTSDQRAILNMRAQVRRIIREVQG